MIARTETINAATGGQELGWERAVQQGVLERSRTRKVWITTPDDRLDKKICEPMPYMKENQNVPIGGNFTTPQGKTISSPTAHPQCRCAMGLRIKRSNTREE